MSSNDSFLLLLGCSESKLLTLLRPKIGCISTSPLVSGLQKSISKSLDVGDGKFDGGELVWDIAKSGLPKSISISLDVGDDKFDVGEPI